MNDETPSHYAICEAVLGPGHFMVGAPTIVAMQRNCFQPTFGGRDAPMIRDEKRRPAACGRVKAAGRRVLAIQHATYMTPWAEARMGAEYPIQLEAA